MLNKVRILTSFMNRATITSCVNMAHIHPTLGEIRDMRDWHLFHGRVGA